jgi:hypothetical protein
VVLPESGGSLSQRVENFDDGVVRFAEAISEVTGVERDGVAFTTSNVSIRDVDILHVIHADRIVLRATARQRIDDAEGTISFAGTSPTRSCDRSASLLSARRRVTRFRSKELERCTSATSSSNRVSGAWR